MGLSSSSSAARDDSQRFGPGEICPGPLSPTCYSKRLFSGTSLCPSPILGKRYLGMAPIFLRYAKDVPKAWKYLNLLISVRLWPSWWDHTWTPETPGAQFANPLCKLRVLPLSLGQKTEKAESVLSGSARRKERSYCETGSK